MTTRVLPPAEWPCLQGTELAEVWPHLDPARTSILVAEQGETIVGHVVLMQAAHAEFFWIAPAYRGKVSVFRRLRDALVGEARAQQVPTILMSALSKHMNGIIAGLGADRLTGDHYVWNLKEIESCLKP
jgi:hypothetical protein